MLRYVLETNNFVNSLIDNSEDVNGVVWKQLICRCSGRHEMDEVSEDMSSLFLGKGRFNVEYPRFYLRPQSL
jgi:hypothetical protein